MTDLFGQFVPFEFVDRMFGVMALTPHTYQVLTKRADRMFEYIDKPRKDGWSQGYVADCFGRPARWFPRELKTLPLNRLDRMPWPLSNVQLGFSAEDQTRFDERWKMARELDIQRWFVWASLEPLLGPIDASSALGTLGSHLSWAVAGGESGPRARPLEVNWIRDLIQQFRGAKVPLFVKQLGSVPLVAACRQQHYDWGHGIGLPDPKFSEYGPTNERWRIHLADRKGATPAQWAEHLRVREFPTVTR
jgi:protein gp37